MGSDFSVLALKQYRMAAVAMPFELRICFMSFDSSRVACATVGHEVSPDKESTKIDARTE
jgi:hypothetical protein